MGNDPVGDEVVDALDVQIVDLGLERQPLHLRHQVQAALGIEEGHAGLHVAGGQEGQAGSLTPGAAPQPGLQEDFRAQMLADALGGAPDLAVRGRAAFHSPTAGARLGGAHRKAQTLQDPAVLGAAADHGKAVHGALAPAVAAEGEEHLAPPPGAGLGPVVGGLHGQAQGQQEALGSGLGIHGGEDLTDGFGIMDQALGGPALAGDEGQCGQLILQGPDLFLETRRLLGGVSGDDPQFVGVLLPSPLEEAHHGFHLALRVGLAGAQAPADTLLAHEVDEVELRRQAQAVAREVHMLGGAGDDLPGG